MECLSINVGMFWSLLGIFWSVFGPFWAYFVHFWHVLVSFEHIFLLFLSLLATFGHVLVNFGGRISNECRALSLPVRENPERTFYWFFEAACPVARDKGEWANEASRI